MSRRSFSRADAILHDRAARRGASPLFKGGSSALFLLGFAAWSADAAALDAFEIQVYRAEVNRPGQFGMELHANYTMQGQKVPEYSGQIPANHVARFTLEPALGVTEWFEVGAYLQSMVSPQGADFGGVKLRGKFVLPTRHTAPFFFGINAELGRVPRHVEEEGWANEFRPILGWTDGRFLVDVNPIIGYALSGPDRFRPDFEPAGKLGVNTDKGFMLGVEYYAGLGLLATGFSPLRDQEHLMFLTFDLVPPAREAESESEEEWECNVAVGRGLTDGTPAQWITKMIVGHAF